MRALIVDDDFFSRAIVQDMLRGVADCHIAANGEEAVGAFQKALSSGRPYDLVCLDLLMPGMDGQEALREMRSCEVERGVVPEARSKIIVISMVEDDTATNDAFFLGEADSFLVKPIARERLLNELRLLGLSVSPAAGDDCCS